MPYFPSSSCETDSSSSFRHCVTTLRSLLRISWFMSGHFLRMRCRSLLFEFFQSGRHEVIQRKANDSNGLNGLLRPRKADFLYGASGVFLRAVGSMNDIVAT